jgi:hypothetical protein
VTDYSPFIRPGWYLAICEDCQPLLPQPFRDSAERDAWAKAHAETGHTVARVDGDPR